MVRIFCRRSQSLVIKISGSQRTIYFDNGKFVLRKSSRIPLIFLVHWVV